MFNFERVPYLFQILRLGVHVLAFPLGLFNLILATSIQLVTDGEASTQNTELVRNYVQKNLGPGHGPSTSTSTSSNCTDELKIDISSLSQKRKRFKFLVDVELAKDGVNVVSVSEASTDGEKPRKSCSGLAVSIVFGFVISGVRSILKWTSVLHKSLLSTLPLITPSDQSSVNDNTPNRPRKSPTKRYSNKNSTIRPYLLTRIFNKFLNYVWTPRGSAVDLQLPNDEVLQKLNASHLHSKAKGEGKRKRVHSIDELGSNQEDLNHLDDIDEETESASEGPSENEDPEANNEIPSPHGFSTMLKDCEEATQNYISEEDSDYVPAEDNASSSSSESDTEKDKTESEELEQEKALLVADQAAPIPENQEIVPDENGTTPPPPPPDVPTNGIRSNGQGTQEESEEAAEATGSQIVQKQASSNGTGVSSTKEPDSTSGSEAPKKEDPPKGNRQNFRWGRGRGRK